MINYQRLFSSNLMKTFFLCIIFYPNFLHGEMTAVIKYEYYTASSNYSNLTTDTQTNGLVSSNSNPYTVRNGQAFTLMDIAGRYEGCQPPVSTRNYSNGIAIIQRGGDCTFSIKITRAKQYGAVAVLIYDPRSMDGSLVPMFQNNTDILSIYIERTIGSILFELARNTRTRLNISLEPIDNDDANQGDVWYNSRGGIIFISVSVCILVGLCVSWFIFYYCQRYRSRTVKDRLQNRLTNAAKKALAKIPLVTITETPHVEESCVICLDTIKAGDTVRQISCGHAFHQHCVDPWLLSHRHCPLCNIDILAAYRISIPKVNSRRHSPVPENPVMAYYTSLATTAATPIVEQNNLRQDRQQQQTVVNLQVQPIPSISGSMKDESNGEQNPSFRSDDDH